MYEYAFLVWGLLFLPLWLFFFMVRKDFRKPMIVLGLIFAVIGSPADLFYTLKDYWHPLNYVPVPSFIFQEMVFVFILAGAQIFIYPYLFKIKLGQHLNYWRAVKMFIFVIISFVLLVVMGLSSIEAVFAGQVLLAFYIWYQRRDLVLASFVNFAYSSIIAFLGIFILFKMYPDILQAWWKLENLYGIFIAGVPLEEIIWLGFTGFGFGLTPMFLFQNRK